MQRSLLRRAVWTLLGVVTLVATEPAADAGDAPVEPPLPVVLPANDEELKRVQDAVANAAKEKSTELLARALVEMQTRRHDAFVATIREHVDSSNQTVQAAAISAAATHEIKDVEKLVRKLLRAKPKGKATAGAIPGTVAAACVDYVDRLDVAGEEEVVLDEHLRKLIVDERRMKQSWAREMVRASLHYLGRRKHKPAVPFLVDEMVGEPIPANPNDPNNPPASYWEARHKLWVEYEGWARWVLKETTGQEYRTAREWAAWLKQQDKKAFK